MVLAHLLIVYSAWESIPSVLIDTWKGSRHGLNDKHRGISFNIDDDDDDATSQKGADCEVEGGHGENGSRRRRKWGA